MVHAALRTAEGVARVPVVGVTRDVVDAPAAPGDAEGARMMLAAAVPDVEVRVVPADQAPRVVGRRPRRCRAFGDGAHGHVSVVVLLSSDLYFNGLIYPE